MPIVSPHAARRRWRLFGVLGTLFGLGLAAALVLLALGDDLSYFRTPSDIAAGTVGEMPAHRSFRLGGMVEKGSLARDEADNLVIIFTITDFKNSVSVRYRGIPPDLFREGQGVIAEGKMGKDGVFTAARLLAKHDENYMPPELAKALGKP
ncbi:MAG: cytochrome c maturation protein CcmE [Alphaproteobacteria bacterium]|nr:cytochrome c maturation protein CcmE [Alphaproteobacteria bacterium]